MLALVSSRLDHIADLLESKGLKKEATVLDTIANSIESLNHKESRSIIPSRDQVAEIVDSILESIGHIHLESGRAKNEFISFLRKEVADTDRDKKLEVGKQLIDRAADFMARHVKLSSGLRLRIIHGYRGGYSAATSFTREGDISGLTLKIHPLDILEGAIDVYTNSGKKLAKILDPLMGHEVIHTLQGGGPHEAKSNSFDLIRNLVEGHRDGANIGKEGIDAYRDAQSEIHHVSRKRGIGFVIKELKKLKVSLIEGFEDGDMDGSVWGKDIPSFLRSFDEEMIAKKGKGVRLVSLAWATGRLLTGMFGEEDYFLDPKEIMSYAYSIVKKAKVQGASKEELTKTLNSKKKTPLDEALYPLGKYKEIIHGPQGTSSSLSPTDRDAAWKKLLTNIHGYIEEVYK
jgi:hypothetical protein